MKSLLIALFLCSCAVGSLPVEEIDQPKQAVARRQPPNPVEITVPSEPLVNPDCKLSAFWEGDCYIVTIICRTLPPEVSVSCGPPRPLWPWEVIPDPPFDHK